MRCRIRRHSLRLARWSGCGTHSCCTRNRIFEEGYHMRGRRRIRGQDDKYEELEHGTYRILSALVNIGRYVLMPALTSAAEYSLNLPFVSARHTGRKKVREATIM